MDDTALQEEERTRLLPVSKESLNQKIDSRPVGHAIENASSNPSIPQSAEKSTGSAKKFREMPESLARSRCIPLTSLLISSVCRI